MSLHSTLQRIPGVVLALVLASAAYLLGAAFPLVGGPVFGILLGMALKASGGVPAAVRPGVQFCSKQLLQCAVVLFGAGLSLGQVWRTGTGSLAVMLSTLAVCLGAAWLVNRWGSIRTALVTLIGVGTGICGASAIAATAPVIQAEEEDVAYAVSTIFAYNVAAVLLFPAIGRLLGMDQDAFGLWAGTAINDTSSVVAAAFSYGSEAGAYATVVKLTRATLIVPIVMALAWWRARGAAAAGVAVKKLIPWFILYFLVAALLNTVGLIPAAAVPYLTRGARFLIVVAMTAVGLSADFRGMARTGWAPLVLGAGLWTLVAVTSLVAQSLTGQL